MLKIAATGLGLRVYLGRDLVDLSKKVRIRVNGIEKFSGIVPMTMGALMLSTAERGDPEQVYPAMVRIPPGISVQTR